MYGTYCRLHVHVSASDIEVIRRARLKLCNEHRYGRAKLDARKDFYREMLRCHHEAQELYRSFQGYTF